MLDRVGRSGGGVSILWHNNRFDRRAARGYDGVYWRLVDRALERRVWVTSAAAVVTRWREATEMSAPDPLQAAGAYVCDSRLDATERGGRAS